jgi:DNA helicase-4
MGFPSRIEDDPVLQLAMPSEDAFADSEERRLFYVALTRAKKSVTLVTVTHKESPFITELVKDCQIEVSDLAGAIVANKVCPVCQKGFLVQRTGRYGLFMGCSRFPRCQGR